MKSENTTTDSIFTLGIASKLSGISVHSIRQYIDRGLILPFRTETNRHLFSEIDIQRLKKIKKYIDDGLNIAGLKALYAQIPAYLVNSCKEKHCNNCKTLNTSHLPCWLTKEDESKRDDRDCRTCAVYMMADPIDDLNKFFLNVKKN